MAAYQLAPVPVSMAAPGALFWACGHLLPYPYNGRDPRKLLPASSPRHLMAGSSSRRQCSRPRRLCPPLGQFQVSPNLAPHLVGQKLGGIRYWSKGSGGGGEARDGRETEGGGRG